MNDPLTPTDRVRLSKQARDQLVSLKRRTGLRQWNVLCRWAFCRSLAEPSTPSRVEIHADSNVEMTWQVFGGRHADVYAALLKQRCIMDGLDASRRELHDQFILHLHRGIGYLFADGEAKSIDGLIHAATRNSVSED